MRKLNIPRTITRESLKANSLLEEKPKAQGGNSCKFHHQHEAELRAAGCTQGCRSLQCCSTAARARGAHLSEEDGQHVLPLEADGQVHQGVAHVEGGRAVQQPHLVRRQLPGNVPSGRLVGFHCSQITFHNSWGQRNNTQPVSDTRQPFWNKPPHLTAHLQLLCYTPNRR